LRYMKRLFEILLNLSLHFFFRTFTANNESLFAIALRV